MDREDKIKHMFYDWDSERKTMLKIQKCQRNWDHDKWFTINEELRTQIVNELLWVLQTRHLNNMKDIMMYITQQIEK